MQVSQLGRRRPRIVGGLAALATAAAMLLVPGPSAQAAPPPNPTDSQLQSAAARKTSLANEVGALSAQVATLTTQLNTLQGSAELAEQKYAYALQKLQNAQAAAATAKTNAEDAQQSVSAAHQQFVAYAQSTYMSGELGGTTGMLLTASDPNVFLQQGVQQQYQDTHQISVIGELQRATVAQSNADAAARAAVQASTAATSVAAEAKQAAEAAVVQTRAQTAQVQQMQSVTQTKLTAARNTLLDLTGQRAVHDAYVKEQARLAEIKRQAELKAQREAAARAAALVAARQKSNSGNSGGNNNGSSSNNNGGNGSGGSSSGPVGGSWTPARGQEAANRALSWLGQIYIWAGGNRFGPTDGGCSDPVSPCGTVGFDCSGLAIYAWGKYMSMDHYAATQYSQAGSYHPSANNLMPGDLLFWSYGGGQNDIHHVAIYIGNGNVVEAPDSGLHVRIRAWTSIGSTYYGATRPLT